MLIARRARAFSARHNGPAAAKVWNVWILPFCRPDQ